MIILQANIHGKKTYLYTFSHMAQIIKQKEKVSKEL